MKKTVLFVGGIVAVGAFLWWAGSIEPNDPNVLAARGLHSHSKIEIFIEGEKIDIPAGIGLVGGHNPIHSHDGEPGVIHMEFDGRVTFKDVELGNFFKIWKREFSKEQLFENVSGEKGVVSMLVNGEESLEFEKYQMKDGDEITIRFE